MAAAVWSEGASVWLPGTARIVAWFAGSAGLALLSSVLVRAVSMPRGMEVLLAMLPAPAIVGMVLAVRRSSRQLDEFQRQIQLEAFALAFGVAAIAFMAYAQLVVADVLGPEDWVFPWLAIFFGYYIGLHASRRRYE